MLELCPCSQFLWTTKWDFRTAARCRTCRGYGIRVEKKQVLCPTCLGLGLRLPTCDVCANRRYRIRFPEPSPPVSQSDVIMLCFHPSQPKVKFTFRLDDTLVSADFKHLEEGQFYKIQGSTKVIGIYLGEVKKERHYPHAKPIQVTRIPHPSEKLLALMKNFGS